VNAIRSTQSRRGPLKKSSQGAPFFWAAIRADRRVVWRHISFGGKMREEETVI